MRQRDSEMMKIIDHHGARLIGMNGDSDEAMHAARGALRHDIR
jgi:hypothetical protein